MTVEPNVLISRVILFVFVSASITTVVLFLTLFYMFPLDKTQIFFLLSKPKTGIELEIIPFTPNKDNIDTYKYGFIKEYIKARNEIIDNASLMKKKWSNTEDSIVYILSTPKVYKDFTNTAMWTAYMNDIPNFIFSCPVEFKTISPRAYNKYAVDFSYFCINNNGQTSKKDYTIILTLTMDNKIKWKERMYNPLGIRVSEYVIESGNGDPLDFR